MKIVHSPDMVAHLWANKSQDTARNSGQTFWFTGAAIYSYRTSFVIAAHLEDGRILWNSENYSSSTTRHKSHAWRALTQAQRDNELAVPCLSDSQLRDLEYKREYPDGKTLPDLAKECAKHIVDTVKSMANMRVGAGPMQSAFLKAKGLEQSADALRAYVAKGKKQPAWTLSRLPESLPADKAGVQAFIKSIAKSSLMAQHDKEILQARQSIGSIQHLIQGEYGDWRMQNIRGTLASIGRLMSDAQRWHELAQGKKSAKVRAVLQELAKVEPQALAAVEKWEAKQARAEIRMVSRDIFRLLRQRGTSSPAVKSGYCPRRESGYYFGKLKAALDRLPADEAGQHADLLRRIERCAAWDVAANNLDSARDRMDTAHSYLPNHPGDAVSYFIQAWNAAVDTKKAAKKAAKRIAKRAVK